MHTQVNRLKHLSHWSWEIGNKGKFRGSSYWLNTDDQQATRPTCAQSLHNSGIKILAVVKLQGGADKLLHYRLMHLYSLAGHSDDAKREQAFFQAASRESNTPK